MQRYTLYRNTIQRYTLYIPYVDIETAVLTYFLPCRTVAMSIPTRIKVSIFYYYCYFIFLFFGATALKKKFGWCGLRN